MAARHHVDARRHHRRGVDERGDRGRSLHGVGQPGVERDLRALSSCTEEEQQRRGGDRHRSPRERERRRVEDVAEVQAAAPHEQDQHAEQEPEVAHAVHDERLLPRLGGSRPLVPEADQQVRAQAHAFPAHEHEQEVVGQHQREHREHEQVEVQEEPAERGIVRHVAGGVDVDQEADPGHDQRHHRRQRIQHERDVGPEVADPEPRPCRDVNLAVLRGKPGQLQRRAHREQERETDHPAREPCRAALAQPVAEQQAERHSGERQRGDQGEERGHVSP